MKKKLGAILMAGVMSISIMAGLAFSAACTGRAKPDFEMPDGGFDTSKDVTITFYHTMNQNLRKILQSNIAEFNKLYPNIHVDDRAIGGYDDVLDQIGNEIVAGNQPDLAYCYADHVASYNRSLSVQSLNDFLPDGAHADVKVAQVKLDENGKQVTNEDGSYVTEEVSIGLTAEQKDMFIPGYYNEGYMFGEGDKMYTMPFAKSTEVLYYNKTYFEANGLTPPKTWSDMEELCKTIRAKGGNEFPFTYDSEANWFITMCEQYNSPYTSLTGDKFPFDNTKNREFVQMFADWYSNGYFTTQSLNGAYTSNLFKEQKSYMCIGSSAGASNQMPTPTQNVYPFEVGITTIPQVDPSKPKVISQGPSICIFKQNDPQRVLASWLLVKYLTTSVDFQAQFSIAQGYVPVLNEEAMYTNETYKNLLDSADPDAPMTAEIVTSIAAKVCMEQENAYYTSPAFKGSSDARREVGTLMTAVFEKKKTIDEAFKYAISKCQFAG